MSTILNDNAAALYKISRFKEFTHLNLDIKEKAFETLEFIENNIWNELYNNDDCNDSSDYLRVSRYANKRIYEIPKVCFRDDEQEDIEEELEDLPTKQINKISFVKITFIFLTIVIMIFSIKSFFIQRETKANILENVNTEQSALNELDKIYWRINDLNLMIRDELIVQKEARKIEKTSIDKVKNYEKEQTELRLQALTISNK